MEENFHKTSPQLIFSHSTTAVDKILRVKNAVGRGILEAPQKADSQGAGRLGSRPLRVNGLQAGIDIGGDIPDVVSN